jgi:hypothetical protein
LTLASFKNSRVPPLLAVFLLLRPGFSESGSGRIYDRNGKLVYGKFARAFCSGY